MKHLTRPDTEGEMHLPDLNRATRECMMDEIVLDQRTHRLYFSKRLNEKGAADYPGLLLKAAAFHDARWFCRELGRDRLTFFEPIRGGRKIRKTPGNAHIVLGESEFNRYYIRGLCRRAIDEGHGHLIVYRARNPLTAREESEDKIGELVAPEPILADLRTSIGMEPFLGYPSGPNSGISLRLP